MNLFSGAKVTVELVRQVLHRASERATASRQQQALFPDLLSLAGVGHGLTAASTDVIL
jgi:hypothetical protein